MKLGSKPLQLLRSIFFGIPLISLWSCITPSEKKDMQNDIFNVQTRLLTLERKLLDTSNDAKTTGESATKRIANTQAELDRIFRDLQQIKGDVDSLKVSVVTGQIPGQPVSENSLAGLVSKLDARMEYLEKSQTELIEALKKAGLNIKTPPKKAEATIRSPEEIKTALSQKRYKEVIEAGVEILKSTSLPEIKSEIQLSVAESYFQLQQLTDAIQNFTSFLDTYQEKEKIPFVKMRLGDSFRQLGDLVTAKSYYEQLVRDYPQTTEALAAKEKLAQDGVFPAS